jgi:hypothetical protein
MFALNPNGENSSNAKGDSKSKVMHFVKLSLYFAAIRIAFVYFGDDSSDVKSTSSSSSAVGN